MLYTIAAVAYDFRQGDVSHHNPHLEISRFHHHDQVTKFHGFHGSSSSDVFRMSNVEGQTVYVTVMYFMATDQYLLIPFLVG